MELADTLRAQIEAAPFNLVATIIFFLAILHTLAAGWFAGLAHRVQRRHDDGARAQGGAPSPSVGAGLLHFLGEVEVVFGLWAVVLMIALIAFSGWESAKHYLNDTVNYTEPLFVVVIMALASTRPIVGFAEAALRRIAGVGGGTPAAWWVDDPDRRAAARIVHHRTGGDDDLRAAAGAPVLRSGAEPTAGLRHAGTAVRERVDRRHADATLPRRRC